MLAYADRKVKVDKQRKSKLKQKVKINDLLFTQNTTSSVVSAYMDTNS